MMERLQDVIRVACEECCLPAPIFNISSVAFGGSQGVFTMVNGITGGITIQACLPEDDPNSDELPLWDGKVAIKDKSSASCIPLTGLIDALQTMLDAHGVAGGVSQVVNDHRDMLH